MSLSASVIGAGLPPRSGGGTLDPKPQDDLNRCTTGCDSVPDFHPTIRSDNPDPRVACALLLDTSSSMSGAAIDELNRGYAALCESLAEDPLARNRTEIAVITFGGTAQLAVGFTEARYLEPSTFTAQGMTPMGAALELGLGELLARKQAYREAGLEYFRPWLFMISDGEPTDGERFTAAAGRVREVEAQKGVAVFAVGIKDANMETLATLSNVREPKMLDGLKFIELFQWLSASMMVVSQSVPGASDADIAQQDSEEQLALPPADGWAHP